jgi:hypothetical protein
MHWCAESDYKNDSYMKISLVLLLLVLEASIFAQSTSNQSVARQWNEALLNAIRKDKARPPIHARNLFHVSVAMYNAWATYDDVASTALMAKPVVAKPIEASRAQAC